MQLRGQIAKQSRTQSFDFRLSPPYAVVLDVQSEHAVATFPHFDFDRSGRAIDKRGLLVLEGVVGMIAGVVAVMWPGITVLALVLLTAAWSLLSGGLTLASAFRLEREHGRGWMILGGAASLIFGVLLVIAPFIGAILLAWWVGAYALVLGGTLLALAFRLRMKKMDHKTLAHPASAG